MLPNQTSALLAHSGAMSPKSLRLSRGSSASCVVAGRKAIGQTDAEKSCRHILQISVNTLGEEHLDAHACTLWQSEQG